MALRDQPYLPLYIQDIMTDEKLNECSASTHGIYIKGLMCLMHKSETYGKILLRQKYQQNLSKEEALAKQLVKHLPYSELEIETALLELIDEKVCYWADNYICQKRMVRDGEISLKRSDSGKEGQKQLKKNKEFASAKPTANSEYEYKDEIEDIITYLNIKANKNFRSSSNKTKTLIRARLNEKFTVDDFKTVIDKKVDDWVDDPKMNEYIRPETLFGTKFESYLNIDKNGKELKTEEARFQNSKGSNAGSKKADIPTGDCSTEWSKQ